MKKIDNWQLADKLAQATVEVAAAVLGATIILQEEAALPDGLMYYVAIIGAGARAVKEIIPRLRAIFTVD